MSVSVPLIWYFPRAIIIIFITFIIYTHDFTFDRFYLSFSGGSNVTTLAISFITPFMFHSNFTFCNSVCVIFLHFHFGETIISFNTNFCQWSHRFISGTQVDNITFLSEHEPNNRCSMTNHQQTLNKVTWLVTDHDVHVI